MTHARFHTAPAVAGFERAAEAYERGRPGYPPSVVRHRARVLRLGPRRTVVELGSGTGKFTRAWRPIGGAVVAIEPTVGMRHVSERELPRVLVVPGTAEAIPLPNGFADAVVCAQAFQWFRARPALREIARILRAGGGLGLVWNIRDETADWLRRVSEILGRYRGSLGARDRRWQGAFRSPGAPFPFPAMRRFRHIQRVAPATVVDRFLSVSSIALLPARERTTVAAEIQEILRTDPMTRGRSTVAIPYDTEVYWTRLAP